MILPDEIKNNIRLDIGFPPAKTIAGLEAFDWKRNNDGELQVGINGGIYKIKFVASLGCYAVAKDQNATL